MMTKLVQLLKIVLISTAVHTLNLKFIYLLKYCFIGIDLQNLFLISDEKKQYDPTGFRDAILEVSLKDF